MAMVGSTTYQEDPEFPTKDNSYSETTTLEDDAAEIRRSVFKDEHKSFRIFKFRLDFLRLFHVSVISISRRLPVSFKIKETSDKKLTQ